MALCQHTNSNRKYVFVSKYNGGLLGICEPSSIHYAKNKKVSSYLQMLNSDDLVVRATDEKSIKLHMRKRKVKETEQENNFAGHVIDENNPVVKHVRMCLSKSFWIELNMTFSSKLGIY